MANILTNLVATNAARYGDREAFSCQYGGSEAWVPTSWNELLESQTAAACALETLGIEPGDMLAVFSPNCPEILMTDFGSWANRAVPVSIYATSSPEQVSFIVRDASARMLFAGDQRQYDVARSVAAECPSLERIVVYDPAVKLDETDTTTMRWEHFLALGRAASDMCRAAVAERTAASSPDDIFTLIYTSGTTGEPKGAVLPHSCMNAAVRIHEERLTMLSDSDTSLCFLPMSHIFEKAWTYYCLHMGIRVAINRDPREVQKALRAVRPTCMCSVPRFWEKVYTGVQDKLAGITGFKRRLMERAIAVGRKRNLQYARLGLKAPWWLETQYRFFDKKVFGPMRRIIGVDRGNIFPTAGAPLSDNIVEFLHSCGINIVIGYGLSETTATVSCYPVTGWEIGTVGTVMPEVQVRIGEKDEIQVKGPTVMRGYYNRPADTERAFTPDGWFRTGDAGRLDDQGAIVLTERIKDLFKTSNGKYIAPQAIESRLGEDRYIEQVAVIGDRRKYVSAIIVPAFEALKEYARNHRIKFRSLDELVQNEEIRKFIAERIERLQKGLAGFEKIKKFTLLPREFSIETGELTNTLKLRRAIINALYADQIEAMYATV
ncbi:MAG: long-chain fatty acid--CoA ligase [Muribaculaceae bacterium]|nr:long-chain fatty acid--CoA ligase [Muribaculaceae bacterium]